MGKPDPAWVADQDWCAAEDWPEFRRYAERWDPAEAVRIIAREFDQALKHEFSLGTRSDGSLYARRPRLSFFTSNTRGWPCDRCGCSPVAHASRGGRRPCAECLGCFSYVSPCAVCGGASLSAVASRICRPCRRLIARKERELWLRNKAELERGQQMEAWRVGRETMLRVKALLKNPELLHSAAKEFAQATTSPTS